MKQTGRRVKSCNQHEIHLIFKLAQSRTIFMIISIRRKLKLPRVFGGLVAAAALLLTACSTVPRSGPTRSDFLAAEGQQYKVAVVDVDASTIDLLSSAKEPSLLGRFGDYRPPSQQRIGVGDTIQITLWEASGGGLFSSPAVDRFSAGPRSAAIPDQVVSSDGLITVPFAGRVTVAGRTPAEVERVVMERLSSKAIDPQALVTVTHNNSSTVTVMTEGGSGKLEALSPRGDRLLKVIAENGGIQTAASDLSVVLSRNGQILRVPLQSVLNDPNENIYVQADDVITLVRDPQTFTAAGATGRNNLVSFDTATLTLDEALGKAGGLVDDRADPQGLFVIRFETGQVAREFAQARGIALQNSGVPVIYHFNLRDPTAFFLTRRFSMRNKDILFVSDAPFSDVQKLFMLINQLVTPAITGITVQNAVK
jgi:polysaccharide export outer membrane protein